ncbi:hypothetical protein PG985_008900 [Apiospora marii]|uniref:uncharacterized protein n=1 Tax=Apiospora marii TaxID=335849 RepID=UPI0031314024
MRFNARNLILGLAALGSIPEGLGRAIPGSDAVALYKNDGFLHARVVVEPVHIGSGGKGSGGKGGEGEGAGGGKGGGNGGKGSTPGGDGGDGDGSPARIGSPDGKGSGGGGSGEQPVHIGAGDKPSNKDPDIWCRGTGCGASGGEKPDPVALGTKGGKGIDLAASPKEGTDYSQRYGNYEFKKQGEPEGADDSIPALGLDKKYGFHEEEGWATYYIKSKDQSVDPAAKMSYGRVTKDGKEYLAMVAHDRHAEYDGNRYKLKPNGDNVKDADGKLELNPDGNTKAVPVAQLVYKGAQDAKVLDKPADKVFLVSENVINDAAKVIIPDALKAVGKGDAKGPVVFKNGDGEEGKQFKILAGLDNNYSYLNTVGRNPGFFKDYKLDSITVVWADDAKAMNMEFHKA